MRGVLTVGVAAAVVMTGVTPASAGTPYQEKITCPIGGEVFEHTSTGSWSTFGARPDGKPYGSWIFPMPIPVCPSNKLPIYSKFSEGELAQLKPLVASEEFRTFAAKNVPYRNAAWLMERTSAKPENIAWMILQASWEADQDPELKRGYQADYVERLRALPQGPDEYDWLSYQARAANGLRELGRFDESITMIDMLSRRTADAKEKAAGAAQNSASAKTLEKLGYLETFLGKLRQVSSAKDSSSEPAIFKVR